MTQYGVLHDGTGYRVYATENGIDKRLLGPRWATPRQAYRYADLETELDALPATRPAQSLPPDSGRIGSQDAGVAIPSRGVRSKG